MKVKKIFSLFLISAMLITGQNNIAEAGVLKKAAKLAVGSAIVGAGMTAGSKMVNAMSNNNNNTNNTIKTKEDYEAEAKYEQEMYEYHQKIREEREQKAQLQKQRMHEIYKTPELSKSVVWLYGSILALIVLAVLGMITTNSMVLMCSGLFSFFVIMSLPGSMVEVMAGNNAYGFLYYMLCWFCPMISLGIVASGAAKRFLDDSFPEGNAGKIIADINFINNMLVLMNIFQAYFFN